MRNACSTVRDQMVALSQQTTGDFEVVVVDNGSTDESVRIVREFKCRLPALTVVNACEGSGVSFARNSGISAARAAHILLCDADDVVSSGWVESMALGLTQFDIVGGTLDVSGLNPDRVRAMPPAPPDGALPRSMKYRPYATGANMGFKRGVFDALGGFDESYVGGHEEVSFAWRAQGRGYTIGFVPEAIVGYRLRTGLIAMVKQRFGYGRSYAQMYAQHQDEPIPRASARHEIKVIGQFALTGPREVLLGRGSQWVIGASWTAGRWYGGVKYRVRPPL